MSQRKKVDSHSVFSGPFSCCCFVLSLVSFVNVSNFRHQWIIWVGISQQRADWQQHLWNSECRTPLVLQNIQANWTIWVNVWMVYSGLEGALRWLEWVISWEMDVQEVHSTCIWAIIWSHDSCLPMVLIVLVDWSSWTVGRWISSQVNQFLLDSLKCHYSSLLLKLNCLIYFHPILNRFN